MGRRKKTDDPSPDVAGRFVTMVPHGTLCMIWV